MPQLTQLARLAIADAALSSPEVPVSSIVRSKDFNIFSF